MRYWLIAIWHTVPRSWVIVSLPVVLPLLFFAGWWIFGALFATPPDPRHEAAKAELRRILPEARAGDRAAQLRAGVIYRDGLTGNAEPQEAFAWFTEAAKKNDAEAQVALGDLYARGVGVRQDFARAAELYRAAANFGRNRQAQFLLGDLYFRGRGVPHDYGQAIEWFRRAALSGHAAAQSLMGTIYENGFGIERNPVEAFVWYALAAEQSAAAMAVRPDIDPRAAAERIKAGLSRLDLRAAERTLAETRRKVRAAG
jgi:TPR repeat protein